VHRDFKPGNVFITKKEIYKIGMSIIVSFFFFLFLLIGDYGISYSMEKTMTTVAGTMYEVE
jgi:serine/threonine protein kinase